MQARVLSLACLVVALALSLSRGPVNAAPDEGVQRVRWVEKCLTDLSAVKVGATRAEVEKQLRYDGGIRTAGNARMSGPPPAG